MVKIALLGLIIASCAPKPRPNNEVVLSAKRDTSKSCMTQCNMWSTNVSSCYALETLQDASLAAYASYANLPFSRGCAMMENWRVVILDTPNGYFEALDHYMYGLTDCETKTIFLGSDPSDNIERSALPHELGHAILCEAGFDKRANMSHLGWLKFGFCSAISSVSSLDIPCDESNAVGEGPALNGGVK